ncbi:hypothetical protein [Paraburkholderia sp. GAS32]|uniref:hypothetical protein n=1 Tax=Paraburkholderia sp. GAS32 TaxID=3035129 RepID=UPI003D1E77BB
MAIAVISSSIAEFYMTALARQSLGTAQRRAFRDRLGLSVRQRFDEQYKPPPLEGACSIELYVDDMLLEVQDTGSPYL